jgi:hypothetical protein
MFDLFLDVSSHIRCRVFSAQTDFGENIVFHVILNVHMLTRSTQKLYMRARPENLAHVFQKLFVVFCRGAFIQSINKKDDLGGFLAFFEQILK